MPYQTHYLEQDGELKKNLNEEQIRTALSSGVGLLWIDIGETSEEDSRFLERTFQFHQPAIEDCLQTTINDPKVRVVAIPTGR